MPPVPGLDPPPKSYDITVGPVPLTSGYEPNMLPHSAAHAHTSSTNIMEGTCKCDRQTISNSPQTVNWSPQNFQILLVAVAISILKR